MNPQDHIRITHLLREREAAFVTVWECEDRIRRILRGADYPFPPPPDLPSRRRRPGTPGAPAAPGPGNLRRRRETEDAYRLTCLCRGQPREALTDDADTVRALLAAPPEVLSVLRIDTVSLNDDGTRRVVECLWSAPSAPGPVPSEPGQTPPAD